MNLKKRKKRTHNFYMLLEQQDGRICHLCGHSISSRAKKGSPLRITLDHVIPKSQGGPDILENLKLAHRVCNERRGNMSVDDYIIQQAML